MPTMRLASPSAATISVLEAKIVTMRCGGAGTVTTRSKASRTVTGSAAAAEFKLKATTSESAVKALTSWVRYPRPAGALSRVSRAANLTNGANLTMCVAQYWLLHQARACTHKSAFCKRGPVNVRFAPKDGQIADVLWRPLCA